MNKSQIRKSVFDMFNIQDEYIVSSKIDKNYELYKLHDDLDVHASLEIDWLNKIYFFSYIDEDGNLNTDEFNLIVLD